MHIPRRPERLNPDITICKINPKVCPSVCLHSSAQCSNGNFLLHYQTQKCVMVAINHQIINRTTASSQSLLCPSPPPNLQATHQYCTVFCPGTSQGKEQTNAFNAIFNPAGTCCCCPSEVTSIATVSSLLEGLLLFRPSLML